MEHLLFASMMPEVDRRTPYCHANSLVAEMN